MAAPDGRRIQRLLARFVGLGYLGYLAVSAPEFGRAAGLVSAWWTPTALFLTFLPGLALLAASFRAVLRTMHILAISAAGGYLTSNVLWLIAWNGTRVEDLRSNWLVIFSGLAGLSAALVLRATWAVGIQVVASTLSSLTNQLGLISTRPTAVRVIYESVWATAFSCVFVVAVLIAVRTARTLDETRDLVQHESAAAAARAARDHERARFDALVHDQVLATLLEAHRAPHEPSTSRHARTALAELDALNGDPMREGEVGAIAVVARIRSVCTEIDDQSTVVPTVTQTAMAQMFPVSAVAVVGAATGEALRNSVRHAGPDAQRTISVMVEIDRLVVRITDFGRGFGADDLGGGRLGIALSITARMDSLPGGRSAVYSRRGSGTTVELEWNR
jgi:signal transduction histidine kinase